MLLRTKAPQLLLDLCSESDTDSLAFVLGLHALSGFALPSSRDPKEVGAAAATLLHCVDVPWEWAVVVSMLCSDGQLWCQLSAWMGYFGVIGCLDGLLCLWW